MTHTIITQRGALGSVSYCIKCHSTSITGDFDKDCSTTELQLKNKRNELGLYSGGRELVEVKRDDRILKFKRALRMIKEGKDIKYIMFKCDLTLKTVERLRRCA